MVGTFEEYLSSLLAFESGWDRARYDEGIIQDWQLDTWAGGSVETFFPSYSSWSQLSDAEWTSMAYRSMNTFGFVGYQFGEALLIDLGYYDDDFYYGNGAATNTWDGIWTGKNGVDSLEEFMTSEAQNVAIREAFGHNLGIIEAGLAAAGQSLDDFIGTTQTYMVGGQPVDIDLTLTGLLSAAHLRGAPAVVSLLLYGTLSSDEFGTSILQYIEQFGGYDSPSVAELITYFEDRLTGDEGLGGPGDPSGSGGNGTAGVTAETADVVITWAWGENAVVPDFDAAKDTIFIDWFSTAELTVSEANGAVVFSIPGNNQSMTLQNVALSDLSARNFTILDNGLAANILGLVGEDSNDDQPGAGGGDGAGDPGDGDQPGDDGGNGSGDSDSGGSGDDDGDGVTSPNGTADVTKADATVVVTWAWGKNTVVDDFDPTADTIFVDWFRPGEVQVAQIDGNVVFDVPGNKQTITLSGVTLSDLSPANFTIKDGGLGAEILGAVGAGQTGGDDGGTGGDGTGGSDGGSGDGPADGVADVFHFTWNWSVTEIISDFAPSEDILDFGALPANLIAVSEVDDALVFEVLNNGGHSYLVEGVQAEDLGAANFTAADWNGVLDDPGGVFSQLAALGNEDLLLS